MAMRQPEVLVSPFVCMFMEASETSDAGPKSRVTTELLCETCCTTTAGDPGQGVAQACVSFVWGSLAKQGANHALA